MGEPLDLIVGRLAARGLDPRPTGPSSYESRCPVHQGDRRNLSIGLGDTGAAVVFCHHASESGGTTCTAAAIVEALGLTLGDLWPEGSQDRRHGTDTGRKAPKTFPTLEAALGAVAFHLKPTRTTSWEYRDPAGSVLMAVARFDTPDGKTFRPLRRVADGWQLGDPPGRLPLYGLDRLAAEPEEPALLVEGEKCADALVPFGYVATTSSHGAQSAGKSDWTPLAGRRVVILPDNDPPGVGYCRTVLGELARLDPRPTVKVVRLPDLADGEDVADWLPRVVGDRVENHAIERVRSSLRTLIMAAPRVDLDEAVVEAPRPAATAKPPEPTPDAPLPEWPAPPEPEAFHGLAGEAIRLIEPHSEADPAGLLLQLLIGFGNAVGPALTVLADGHRHPPVEFGVCVGDTSRARKGTSWRRVRALLNFVDADWADAKVINGLSSGEGLINEIRDPGDDEDDGGVVDKRLLVVEGEFGNVLRMLAREGNSLSGILRLAWDCDTLRTLTKHSPIRATRPHVSVVGHVTIEELARYLSNVEIFNGLGNRVLWAAVRRSKRLPFGGDVPVLELARLGRRLAEAAGAARQVGDMAWTEGARRLWESSYTTLTDDRPGLWGAITSRAEAHVLRLALIYAALDGAGAITDTHVRAALALWRYCDRSTLYLFGGSVGDRDADAILAALREQPEGLTRNQIRQTVFARNRGAEDMGRALALLKRYGLAWHDTVETAGRPAERWHAYARNAISPAPSAA